MTAPRIVSDTHAQVAPGAIVCKSLATHRALITCDMSCNMSYATWYEGTAELLSLTKLKSHLFELYFIG